MNAYQIEKGVPLPGIGSGRQHGSTKYPLREMKPGDSFLIDEHDRQSIYAAAIFQLGKKGQITVRREHGTDKFRVWRK